MGPIQDYSTEQAAKRIVPAGAGVILGVALQDFTGPAVVGPAINPLGAIAFCVTAFSGVTLAANGLLVSASFLDWLAAKLPRGLKGTAGWVTRLSQIRQDLVAEEWAPYWGTLKGQAIFADYQAVATTIGTTGSGKGVSVVQPNILSIFHSKTVVDFKGELSCVLANALRKRGETVRIINIGDLWTDILGKTDQYNPLCIIADNYTRSGGLLDISDDIHEMCMQLLPEPAGKGGKDGDIYFRDGSRTFISFAIQTCVMIEGGAATLGDVAQMLTERSSQLLKHALWACGRLAEGTDEKGNAIYLPPMPIEESPWASLHAPEDLQNYIAYYRATASSVADLLATEDSKTAESFLSGAQQALRFYNISTRAHRKTKGTSFRFSELKEGDKPTTVFIVADSSKIEAQKPVLGLLQWCMLQELKRHPNKERPVYLIADECTNFKIANLGSLITWGRGYGLRIHLIFQSMAAFLEAYGQNALDILFSEAEIFQFLPGQREESTLKRIETKLGEQSVIAQTSRGNSGRVLFSADDFDLREENRALMTADEIRRSKKALLFIRNNKPMQTDLPPIAAIHPFRTQIDVNPFHGKPFLKPITLRLARKKPKLNF